MPNVMDTVDVDPSQAKKLWYALYGVLYAIEQLELKQSVNRLVDQDSNMGAFDFARIVLDESFVPAPVPDDDHVEQGEE